MDTRGNLYKLIQLGLYSTTDIGLSKDIDWKELIDFSIEQGVCAIAFNGLQQLEKEEVASKSLLMK